MSSQKPDDKKLVLIVDDQPENIHALANPLREDYQILAATSGSKALEIAHSENPPDLILLDIMMPEMDGYEVCRRLKASEQTNRIPVIFVSARDTTEDEEMGFSLGAVDYISKPLRPTIVRARVKNHMDLKIKTDMLEELSMQDGLTNIPNRRFFEQSLDKEWQRSLRNGLPFSLVMMDIDNFKSYNDNYGHGAGDLCLQTVARGLKNSLDRPMDLVARYGGEEFVALLPETDLQGATHVAKKLRRVVEELGIKHEHSKTASVVTLSLGVASHSEQTTRESGAELLKAADNALYRAKEQGRNQVQTETKNKI